MRWWYRAAICMRGASSPRRAASPPQTSPNGIALGSGVNGTYPSVSALAVSGSDLYAGGSFSMAGGKVSANVARAIVNPPVLAIESDGFGGYFLRFSGVPGFDYRLQRAPVLRGPWATSSPQTAPAS